MQLLAASIGVALEWVDENHFETTEPSPGTISRNSALCSFHSVISVAC